MTLLRVTDLTFKFPQAKKNAVQNVSFEIEKGSYVAILGPNGSGKSTLARLIAGFLEPASGTVEWDDAVFRGKQSFTPGIVFQSPRDQIVSGTVQRDTSFGPENIGLSIEETNQRVEKVLSEVQLLEKLNSSTVTLSLGQTQKLALAGILVLNQSVLILDESLSMIDPLTREDILNYLDELNKSGITIIHVTHDSAEARRAHRILAMDKGEIFFTGTPTDLLKNRELERTLFGEELMRTTPANFFDDETDSSPNALVFDNITFGYEGGAEVFAGFSLAIKKGTLNALVGKSGCGKSTLFEIACGLLKPKSGNVFSNGKISFALQDNESALFEEFAADDVSFGPANAGLSGKELKKRVQSTMDLVGLPFAEFADRKTVELSGGEKRKLSLAGIIALDADIIILDEPTSALDPASRVSIMHTLRKICDSGKTVLFSTHRLEEAAYADRYLQMKDGKIASDTKSAAVQIDGTLQTVKPVPQIETLSSLRKKSESSYVEKKSVIHSLGSAAKFVVFLAIFLSGLVVSKLMPLVVVAALSLVYAVLAKFPPGKMCIRILKMLPWIAVLVVFQVLFYSIYPTDKIYFEFGRLSLTTTKINLALNSLLHVVAAIASISAFMYSTDENQIIDGMKKLFRSRYAAMIVGIVFRFIPLLMQETNLIMKAQIVRGGMKSTKGLFKRVKSLLPIFVPLFVQTIKRAEKLGDTLTARQFR